MNQKIPQPPTTYRTAIARNLIGLLEGRLVYYEPIPTVSIRICRIVVQQLLSHHIFNLRHVSPLAGHMSEYKTLYLIRLRF